MHPSFARAFSHTIQWPVCASVVLLVAGLGTAPAAAQGGTKVLRGKVVSLNRAPVEGVRIRVAQFGDPVVLRSGEFVQEIPAGVQSVVIESRDPALEVVYPPAGRVPVPAGDEPIVVMVGEPVERTITRALAERRRLSEQLLTEYGVQTERLSGVEAGMQRILERLDLREADLRDEVRRKERQAEAYPLITEAISRYVLEVRDFHATLALLGPLIERAPQQAFDALRAAVTEYNQAYEHLRTRRGELETRVEHDWPNGAVARRDLTDFLDNMVEQTHQQHVLALNGVLAAVQEALFARRRDARYREAMAELSRRLAEFERALGGVEARSSRILEQLRPV